MGRRRRRRWWWSRELAATTTRLTLASCVSGYDVSGTVEGWLSVLDKACSDGASLALPASVDNTTVLQR